MFHAWTSIGRACDFPWTSVGRGTFRFFENYTTVQPVLLFLLPPAIALTFPKNVIDGMADADMKRSVLIISGLMPAFLSVIPSLCFVPPQYAS